MAFRSSLFLAITSQSQSQTQSQSQSHRWFSSSHRIFFCSHFIYGEEKQPLHFCVPRFAARWKSLLWKRPWPPVTSLHCEHVYVSVFFKLYPFAQHVWQTYCSLGLSLCRCGKYSCAMNFLHCSTIHTLPFRLPDLHSRHSCVPLVQSRSKFVLWKTSRWPVSPQRLQMYVGRLSWHV